MEIRRGEEKDITGINRLLEQVLEVHHSGRPDLFKSGVKKYTDRELLAILHNDMNSFGIFVCLFVFVF